MFDFTQKNDFSFFVPIDIAKSERQPVEKQKRWIEGIASTIDRDLQAETVIQRGIDFSYFIKFGFFNDDHKPGPENKVGQPTEVKVTKEGLYVKGFLFVNHKGADGIWELIHAIKASGSDRKVGFSIQGKVLKRAGSRILSCWVQDIAITAAPINTNTYLDVVKSLYAIDIDKWCEGEHGIIYPEESIGKAIPCDSGCKNGCKSCSHSKKESSLSEVDMDLKKDIDGGIGSKKDDSKFHSESLETGTNIEKEHTKIVKDAEKIAKDHLNEDPNYYTKLKEVERRNTAAGESSNTRKALEAAEKAIEASKKALCASGSVLVPESLEKDEKHQEFGKGIDETLDELQIAFLLQDTMVLTPDEAVTLSKGVVEMHNLLEKEN
jgi:hypothetical protein